jgi:DNA-binding MarR family transcriptional regulator
VPAPSPTELFLALGSVVKRLRHSPLPGADQGHALLAGAQPAPRHIAALLQIATDGPIGMSELAERLHVSLATASQVVTELADWGLIERTGDEADRRRTLVSVAAEHRPLTRAIIDQRLRPLQRTLRRLEPDEAAALLRGLVVLAEELGAVKTAAAKEFSR